MTSNVSDRKSEIIVSELEELLECPVCSELPVYTPIFQCLHGHLICSTCHTKLQQCPQCRKTLGKIRNLLAEKLLAKISSPCRFANNGCTARLLHGTVEPHLQSCPFREFNCPVNNCHKPLSCRLVFECNEEPSVLDGSTGPG